MQRGLARFVMGSNESLTYKELRTLSKAYGKMHHLEDRKQLQPKFSQAMKTLAQLLNLGHVIQPHEQSIQNDDSLYDLL